MTNKKIVFKKDLVPAYDYSSPKVGDCFRHRTAGTIYMVVETSTAREDDSSLYVLVCIDNGVSYGDAQCTTRDLFYGNKELFHPLVSLEVIAD